MKKLIPLVLMLVAVVGCSGSRNHYKAGSQEDFERNAGDRVFFAFDSSAIEGSAPQTLNKQSEWLKSYPSKKVTVEGHCDIRGTREYNLALGERRAYAVKRYLVSQGIDAERVDTVSFGKERPAVVGEGEEVHAQNRRAVVIVKE